MVGGRDGPGPAAPVPLLCVLSLWLSLVWLRSSQDSGCPGQSQVGGVPAEVRLEGPGGPGCCEAAGVSLGEGIPVAFQLWPDC